MCKLFSRKKSKKETLPGNQDNHWLKIYGISLRVYPGTETEEQFLRLYDHMSRKLGTPVPKTTVLRHALAIADQMYQQEIGIGTY